jgi:hypothetical protein
MSAVFLFPAPRSADRLCPLCLRAVAGHRFTGRGFRCVQDVVVGQDQQIVDRRARLAHLRTRVVKVQPFGIDGEAARA